MGVRDGAADADAPDEGEPLPDFLALELADLRTIQHPVLTELLAELTERTAEPGEMLWGFNNAF
jgi:FXSXX-COOH protein